MADKVDKGKKRKRHTDGSSKPSKKVSIEDTQNIKVSFREPEKWTPVIASTPGLALPTNIPLKPYIKPRRNASERSGPTATTELLLHSSAHPKLDYTAREEEVGGADSLLKHYIGVYDPKSGKLDVMVARKMVVRGVVREHQATADDQIPLSMREQRNQLGEAFGTKKARKAIASVTENAIGPVRGMKDAADTRLGSGAAAVIASMADAAADMATKDQLQEEADAAKPRPKANLKATIPAEAYSIETLIGKDIFQHIPILDWITDVKNKKEFRLDSRFVASRIQRLASDKKTVDKIKILRYLYILLLFHMASKPTRGGRSIPKRDEMRKKLGAVPDSLVESIKRKFSDAGFISKFKVDLLITHICALAFWVDNFEVDMFELRQDLKLELKEMSQYFHEIGAKVVALPEGTRKTLGLDKALAAQRKVAKLKIPLEFPKIAFSRKTR